MSEIAIKVEGIGKQYRLGATREKYYSLRDSIMNTIKSPFRKFSRMSGKAGPENEMFWALKDVSFEVQHGEVLGIIGRNGTGKSTLLKILSRITEPTAGQALLYGRVGSLLEVGTGFHPELTGRENIYMSGAILGMRKFEINQKFDEIVDFSGVEKFLDTPAKRYSSGMYVRLAFAVAAHLDPEILLVDEVLAVGDADFQKKCIGKMGEVVGLGKTVLLVSHQMTMIEKLCPRSLMLEGGKIVCEGKSATVIKKYLSSGNQRTNFPLKDRKDRIGSGVIRFTSVTMEDEASNHVDGFRCGYPAVIVCNFENNTTEPLRNVVFKLAIDAPSGDRIALLDSQLLDYVFDEIGGDYTSCLIHIPRMPLAPGRYSFTLVSRVHNELADVIKQAGFFDVLPGDYWGSGKLPPPEQGYFLIEHHYSLR